MQIRAIAVKTGYTNSQIVSATYTVESGVNSTPWQMYVSDAEMDYRMNCDLREEQIIVYYTDTDTVQLKPDVVLYSDDQLTLPATFGYYRDVNDRLNSVIWKIASNNDGKLITTNLSCRL